MTIADDLAPLAQPCESLSLLEGNPRRGNVDVVADSLNRFGQRKPIVARRGDRVVIAGNHTLQAARKLGWDEIAVVFVEDDDAVAKAYALADNRTAELGGYDDEALAAMIAEVQSVDPALLADTGWTGDDLAALLAGKVTELPPALNDGDDAPAAPRFAHSKPGDLWRLGPHRVLCGDSTDVGAYDALLDEAKVDLVWTDPPYGVAYVGKTADALTIENDRLDDAALADFLRGALGAALTATKPGACWYVAAPARPLHLVFATVLTELGVWRQTLTWVKDQFVLGHSDYHYRHEPIFYGWTPGAAHHALGDRTQDTVWEIPRPKRSAEHPTMKPVALIARAIENSTNLGALVLDPFGGSGSTLIAAHDTGRVARLIELDPVYVDVVCRRYQEHTGTLPVLDSTGQPHDFTTEG